MVHNPKSRRIHFLLFSSQKFVSWFWEQGLHMQLNITGTDRMKNNGGKDDKGADEKSRNTLPLTIISKDFGVRKYEHPVKSHSYFNPGNDFVWCYQ
jgi:hypothetical protein